jgi:hypothetical protein
MIESDFVIAAAASTLKFFLISKTNNWKIFAARPIILPSSSSSHADCSKMALGDASAASDRSLTDGLQA